jgi:hypothetical protein
MNAKAAISTAAITKATIIRVPSPPQDMKSIYWLENKEGLQEASKGFSEAMKWWEKEVLMLAPASSILKKSGLTFMPRMPREIHEGSKEED